MASLAGGTQVASVSDPFRSKTLSKYGRTAYATVTYEVGAKELTDASRNRLEEAVHDARDGGLTVEAGERPWTRAVGRAVRPS